MHGPRSGAFFCLHLVVVGIGSVAADGPKLAADFGGVAGFYHGVASGSPLHDAVILWTRYTPKQKSAKITLEYRIAEVQDESGPLEGLLDPEINPKVRHGKITTSLARDWTAKVDMTGLTPKTWYAYGFSDGNTTSPVGRTKTAPAPDDPMDGESLKFAVFSCSNFKTGYFHLFDIGANIEGLDFWIHLGDYIYEAHATGSYERKQITEPQHECVTLEDYRLRYASTHTDRGLQKLRATAPLALATWDDHEFADNSYTTGARKHDAAIDGPWSERVRAAVKAYLEWIPIRTGTGSMGPFVDGVTITQRVEFGQLATFVSMDTRISHRSAEPAELAITPNMIKAVKRNLNITAYREEPLRSELMESSDSIISIQHDPNSKVIGDDMVEYTRRVFAESKAAGKPWQVFAVPVTMGSIVFPPMDKVWTYAKDDAMKKPLRKAFDKVLKEDSGPGAWYRASIPLSERRVCYGMDDWCGAKQEQRSIFRVFEEETVTPIVLGGDTHDSWAYQLFRDGNYTGEPISVCIAGPGVTSGGTYSRFTDVFEKTLVENLGYSNEEVLTVVYEAFKDWNEGMKYVDVYQRGFIAVELTETKASFEFFHVNHGVHRESYDKIEADYGGDVGMNAPFFCGIHLESEARRPGSLEASEDCSAISFRTKPISLLSSTFPSRFVEPTSSPAGQTSSMPSAAPITSSISETPSEIQSLISEMPSEILSSISETPSEMPSNGELPSMVPQAVSLPNGTPTSAASSNAEPTTVDHTPSHALSIPSETVANGPSNGSTRARSVHQSIMASIVLLWLMITF